MKLTSLRSLVLGTALALMTAAAAQAQTLVVARGADGNSLDAHEARSFEAIKIADWIYDGLVRFDGNTQKIVPALAESWTTSDDGLIWTFNLRQGVKFHDGSPFNADAVVFSFERQRDKEHPFNQKTFLRWSAKFSAITKTEAINDHTVKVTLKEPAPTLLVNMAFYIGYIVSPTAVKKDPEEFRNNPVGTGPFKFVRYERDNLIELARNDDYWQGAPKVERLIVRTIPDNDVRLLALKKGEVQLIYGVPFPQFSAIDEDPDLQLLSSSTLGISMMSMNVEKKPFDDIRVRKAISHAINTDRLFKTVFYGRGFKANQPLPPDWFGHAKDVATYEYDPDKAKALLAEAGYPNGFETDLLSWTNPRPYLPAPRDAVALIKTDLAKVGIEVQARMMKWGAFRAERGKGTYGMTFGGWVSGTLDPDGMIYALFHSRYIREVDSLNWARWRNDEKDSLLDRARALYEQDKRAALYEDVERVIAQDVPAVYFAHPVTAIAARSELKNVFIHASNWVPLHDVYFAN